MSCEIVIGVNQTSERSNARFRRFERRGVGGEAQIELDRRCSGRARTRNLRSLAASVVVGVPLDELHDDELGRADLAPRRRFWRRWSDAIWSHHPRWRPCDDHSARCLHPGTLADAVSLALDVRRRTAKTQVARRRRQADAAERT
jgi:hypothetical protein